MRKFICFLLTAALCIFCTACENNNTASENELLRFHVRANSNSDEDQQVKLLVRNCLVDYLEPKLSRADNLDDAYDIIATELGTMRRLAIGVLTDNGFYYGCTVRLDSEYFPTRSYGELVVPSGYYTALVVELGSGNGDNWWCVLYPSLCYADAHYSGVEYRSIIADIIRKFFGSFACLAEELLFC